MFRLERFLARGAAYRLLFIAAVLAAISVAGGWIVMVGEGGFDEPGEAFWWAFLRLSDPGYLGDDEGRLRVVVATLLTVAGYVVFLGALVAIMTQWLNAIMERLDLGLTPVNMRGHVAILGWTERTPAIVREMLASQPRLQRWLARRGARRLRVTILAERVDENLRQELVDEVGGVARIQDVVLRSGSPLRIEHLERVAAGSAGAVVVPGADFPRDGLAGQDARTIKIMLAVAELVRRDEHELVPAFVGELYDLRTTDALRAAYPGRCELVSTEPLVGRLLAACMVEPGLAGVVDSLLEQGDGPQVTVIDEHELDGRPFREAVHTARRVPIGFVRGSDEAETLELNPKPDTRIESSDRLLVVRRERDATEPGVINGAPRTRRDVRRVLVLGWNRKAPSMLAELHARLGPEARVLVISMRTVTKRTRAIKEDGVVLPEDFVEHRVADYSSAAAISVEELNTFDGVLLLTSDALASGQDADARSIAALLWLARSLRSEDRPAVLVELADPSNIELVQPWADDVLVSSHLVARLLGQVVLRRELNAAIADLLGGGGSDLRVVSAGELGLDRRCTYGEIVERVSEGGCIALGLALASETGPRLLPETDESFDLQSADGIVLLGRQDAALEAAGETEDEPT